MEGIKVAKHHLVSKVHQKCVKAGGSRTPGDIHVYRSQCSPPPEVGLDWQSFRCVEVGTPYLGGGGRGTVDEGLEREAREGRRVGLGWKGGGAAPALGVTVIKLVR